VAASSNPQNDFPLEASIPEGAVALESIPRTEELRRRSWRPPDYEKENRALVGRPSLRCGSFIGRGCSWNLLKRLELLETPIWVSGYTLAS